MNTFLRLFAAMVMLSVSLFGIVVNVYVMVQLMKKRKSFTGFLRLCLGKTFGNTITCFAFFFWSAPCTFINGYYLPHNFNVIWGQIAGWGAYIAGMLIQLGMSLNRLFASYFPLQSSFRHPVFNIMNFLFLVFIISVGYTVVGLRTGCGYYYEVDLLSWNPESEPCAQRLADFMFYSIFTLSSISNSSNVATFIKLFKNLKNNEFGLAETENIERTKRSRIMFAQSVTQDCLHVIDMLACQVVYKFNDALWFQFICMSVVWLSIHVLDGVVILMFNKDIQPKFLRKIMNNESMEVIRVSTKSRTNF